MAIRDVLWACPLCRTPDGLRQAGRRETCRRCGAVFRRGAAATITAEHEGKRTTRAVADWLRELGEPEIPEPGADGVVLGPERVIARVAAEETSLRSGGELLGWREVYGPKRAGQLILTTDSMQFEPDHGGSGFAWPLQSITVVQPSSSALQIAAGKTVASVKFPESSLRLWSRALTICLRRKVAATGCEIIEFQPLIRTRAVRPAAQ